MVKYENKILINVLLFVFVITTAIAIVILAEAKLRHGAARDSWFQESDASNEWLEPVDDSHYDKLP